MGPGAPSSGLQTEEVYLEGSRTRKLTLICTVSPPPHSWVGQSPGARTTLLWALAAALERRESALTSRLERHGVTLKDAKAEVKLSARQLRAWGTRAQAQGHVLQVRGLCEPADSEGSLGWESEQGSGSELDLRGERESTSGRAEGERLSSRLCTEGGARHGPPSHDPEIMI